MDGTDISTCPHRPQNRWSKWDKTRLQSLPGGAIGDLLKIEHRILARICMKSSNIVIR